MSSSQKIEGLCKMPLVDPDVAGSSAGVVNASSSTVVASVGALQQEFYDAGSGPGLGVCGGVVVVASSGGSGVEVGDDHLESVNDAMDLGSNVEKYGMLREDERVRSDVVEERVCRDHSWSFVDTSGGCLYFGGLEKYDKPSVSSYIVAFPEVDAEMD